MGSELAQVLRDALLATGHISGAAIIRVHDGLVRAKTANFLVGCDKVLPIYEPTQYHSAQGGNVYKNKNTDDIHTRRAASAPR